MLANGSMSSAQSGEDVIRRAMVEADVVDCMVALPGQLFYSTQIPACLWFLARNKNPGGKLRDRRGEVLFIDARKLGTLVDRTRKEFSDDDIAKIAETYHAWREGRGYEDVPGFCKAAKLEEIKGHNHVLTPGRYVGAADVEDDDVPFVERFSELRAKLEQHFAEAENLKTSSGAVAGEVLENDRLLRSAAARHDRSCPLGDKVIQPQTTQPIRSRGRRASTVRSLRIRDASGVSNRREADIANRGCGRLNWADSRRAR